MKYYIIAGEASGDLHGSNLIKEIKKLDPKATIRCWGGDEMQQAGGELVIHYRHIAFMGFVEVLHNLSKIINNLKFCKQDIELVHPDALILIDYPGFNLRIAKWAKQKGIKVIYYISPQVWAWKENRVKMMKKCIDKMLVILPFEKEFYEKNWSWNVEYVGHPLIEVIENYKAQNSLVSLSQKPIIALLPGSRKQEILKKLPVMLKASTAFPDYQFIVAKAPGIEDSFYNVLLKDYSNVSFVTNQTYNLVMQAKAALVTSGTATLETALFGIPQVVCYKGSTLSYLIAKQIIKIKFISLVNLMLDKPVVKELIQDEMNPENLKLELGKILQDESTIATIKTDYADLQKILSIGGNASENAAISIVNFLR
ncbi:MAG: lipid-A-disaccharide synthase [Chitinophagaceae bacterium]|nr:MAG: lipid-A-disaccharide synthase [Chitinophagaceae bacterium]